MSFRFKNISEEHPEFIRRKALLIRRKALLIEGRPADIFLILGVKKPPFGGKSFYHLVTFKAIGQGEPRLELIV